MRACPATRHHDGLEECAGSHATEGAVTPEQVRMSRGAAPDCSPGQASGSERRPGFMEDTNEPRSGERIFRRSAAPVPGFNNHALQAWLHFVAAPRLAWLHSSAAMRLI